MVVSFDQNARKFCFETEWIGSVKLEKFWKINSTFQGESFVLVRPVRWNLFWFHLATDALQAKASLLYSQSNIADQNYQCTSSYCLFFSCKL